jgi:hypothetical protein
MVHRSSVERIGGHNGAFQGQQSEQLRHRRDLVRFGVGSYLRHYQPLFRAPRTVHVQVRLAAGAIERTAQNLAIDNHRALHLLGELSHKPLTMHHETDPIREPETVDRIRYGCAERSPAGQGREEKALSAWQNKSNKLQELLHVEQINPKYALGIESSHSLSDRLN